jgi:hypothetical protein
MTISEAAAYYATRFAWRVIPLHTIRGGHCTCGHGDCSSPGKHPRCTGWQQAATTDPATITRLWQRFPGTNIGVLTGDILALDSDARHGGADSLADLERQHGALPLTPHSHTGGGGDHYLFRAESPVGNKVNVARGLDIRGVGGFIVVPPSLHGSGRRYAWDVAAHVEDTPLAPAPPWLMALCAQDTQPAPGSPEDELHLVLGERNDRLFRLACGWRRKGIGAAALLDMLRAVNAHHVDPPLAARELAVIVESVVARYVPVSDDDLATDALIARALGVGP